MYVFVRPLHNTIFEYRHRTIASNRSREGWSLERDILESIRDSHSIGKDGISLPAVNVVDYRHKQWVDRSNLWRTTGGMKYNTNGKMNSSIFRFVFGSGYMTY